MRSKNASKNLLLYIIYELLTFGCGLLFPRYIIGIYGSEINGLTSTISRVLSLIMLIQAGAVGAAIYQMYKPVAEKDYETQSAIIYASKRFYNIVSLVYLAASIGLGIFYSFYLKNDTLSFIGILISFLILAFNGFNILLFNSICDIFVSSHQKRYYLSIALICELFVRYSLLSFVLIFKLHYLFIYCSYFLGGLTSVLINLLFYKKLSKGIINKNPNNKNYVIPDRKYLTFSSVGSEVVNISPSIIITTFVSLTASSVFSVYAMIFTSIRTMLNSIQLSFSAIFGNITKTESEDRIFNVHSFIELFTIVMGTIVSCCAGFLIVPFIMLYTNGIADANYLYVNLSIFVVAFIVIFTFRTSFGYVSTVYGLFKDICVITLLFGGLGIVISVLSVIFAGMPYVMIGLIFNELGCSIVTLIVLKKKVPWFKMKHLFIRSMVMLFLASASTLLYFVISPTINNWLVWIVFGLIAFISSSIVMVLYCVLFERKYIKMFFAYVKTLLAKRKQSIAE